MLGEYFVIEMVCRFWTKVKIKVLGTLIRFQDRVEQKAYEIIASIEPDKIYRWEVLDVQKGKEHERANVLVGRTPQRGSHPFDGIEWTGETSRYSGLP